MNKEKIIAGIEKYVETLSDTEKNMYKQSMNKFTLTENKEAKAIYPILELTYIVQALKQEIKEQAQKETNGGNYVKRSKLVTKLLGKCYREEFKKAWYEEINGEKMQCCIIDGFYAYMFKNALDIPEIETEAENKYTVKKLLPDYKNFDSCEIDIAEAKTALKLHKAKKDKTRHLTEINGKFYTTEYLINVVEGLGGSVKMYQSDNSVKPDILESENGLAILCPVKP